MKTTTILCVLFAILALASPARTQTFANQPVTTATYTQSETAIAVTTLDNSPAKLQLAAWNDLAPGGLFGLTSKAGYAFSTTGGNTWIVNVVPSPTGYGYDPSVGFDRYGNSYYAYIDADSNFRFNQMVVSRTTNYGQIWSHKVVANNANEDKPYMAIDNTGGPRDGRIYVAWVEFDSSYTTTAIKFAYSSDHGANFSTPDTLATGGGGTEEMTTIPKTDFQKGGGEGQTTDYVMGPFPSVTPNGDVYVVWTRPSAFLPGVSASIELKKSTDGGVNFGPTTTVATTTTALHRIGGTSGYQDIRTDASTMMATNPATGDIYIAFTQLVSGNLKGYFTRSTNNGASWSTPILCTGSLSGWQYWPWIAVYPSGKNTIAFRHSANQQTVDTYVSESIDRGVTFQTPIRVTDQATSPSSLLGRCHYFGNTAVTGFSFPVWDDYRNHTPQNSKQADVYWACLNRQSTSSSADATSSGGSGRKTVYNSADSRWHSVFQSNNQIVYAYSTTDGVYWGDNSSVNGTTSVNAKSSPSISVYQNNPHVVFTSSSGLFYNRKLNDAWLSAPYQLAGLNRETPSLAIDNSGYGHVLFVYRPIGGAPGTPNLTYGNFNTADSPPSLASVISLDAGGDLAPSPSIALDANDVPRAVWSKGGEIYYADKTSSSWSSPLNISNSGTASNPTVWCNGLVTHVAWQDNSAGEIYYRTRNKLGGWSSVQNISNTSGTSTNPTINGPFAGLPVILWADSTGGNWDIKYRWMGDANVNTYSATSGISSYPSFSFKQTGADAYRMYAIWTEGSGAPYEIPPVTVDISTIPQRPLAGEGDPAYTHAMVQNFPNPFNPSTTFTFTIPGDAFVSLKIFDVLGREVATLVNEVKKAGNHHVTFDASKLASGVYIYKLQAGAFSASKKMLLTK